MKGSEGHLRCRCVWWSRRGHLKVSLRLTTQWFLTWAFQITYRTMYIHIGLPLFPECHNDGALCGWNVMGSHRDAICVPGSEAQQSWAWLITQTRTLQGSITPRPQGWSQSARLQSSYKACQSAPTINGLSSSNWEVSQVCAMGAAVCINEGNPWPFPSHPEFQGPLVL